MNATRTIALINLLLTVLLLAGLVYLYAKQERKAYVLNQRIFDEFQGKKELETRLVALRQSHRQQLDSIVGLIKAAKNSEELYTTYQQMSESYQLQYEQTSEKYTSEIWSRINRYVTDYGARNNYQVIFGAAGDGGLMYADKKMDITDDVIKFINERYKEGGNN
jgi:outer membrane protein